MHSTHRLRSLFRSRRVVDLKSRARAIPTGLVASLCIAALATVAAGCGEVDAPTPSSTAPIETRSDIAAPAAPSSSTWNLSDGRHVTVAAFEGWVNPAAGTWHIAMIEPDVDVESPWRTASQPLWCALESLDGGEVTIASVEAPVPVLPGELPLPAACEGPGINSAPFEVFGALCGAVRVSSLLDDLTLENVYAEIFEFTGTDQQIGYRAPLGSGAVVPNEDYPLSQQYGLWSYGDIAPGESVDVVWTFRNNEPGGTEFRFSGRLVHEVHECTPDRGPNGVDDDCDGVIDNGCGIFEGGVACVVDADCFSGECETVLVDPDCVGPTCATERQCTSACPAGVFGAACDQTCPGGAATPCSGSGSCDDGVDGSGLCTCDPGYAGADCSETCPGGLTCSGNGVCDASGPAPVCVCDPLTGAHGEDCAMTCSDGEQNGDEEGVDCGGPCAAPCTLSPFPDVQAGGYHTCGLRADGTILCWGDNFYEQTNVPALPAGVSWSSVAAGYHHTCGVRTNGGLQCWGRNNNGQTNVPALPAGVSWSSAAAGAFHACGVRTNGGLQCWGRTSEQQTNVPALPAGVSWSSVAAGDYHTCGVRTDGGLQCWGANWNGQANVPALPAGASWSSVSTGISYTCGVRTNGELQCWGGNWYGRTDVPALPAGVSWSSVAAGGYHTCGVRTDGGLQCWGWNSSGQTNVPALSDGVSWSSVAAGGYHTCGRSTDGVWECWGNNGSGRLKIPPGIYD